jgi:hypothetical protein
VSAHIGAAVAEAAYSRKLTDRRRPDDLLADMEANMYAPGYPSYD